MPIQQVRQKGRTEAFGDLLSGLLSGIATGEQLKRTRKLEDRDAAMRIWQLAQRDPLLSTTPMFGETMARAGLGGIKPRQPMTAEEILTGVPVGYGASVDIDPFTGRAAGARYSRIDPINTIIVLRSLGIEPSPELIGRLFGAEAKDMKASPDDSRTELHKVLGVEGTSPRPVSEGAGVVGQENLSDVSAVGMAPPRPTRASGQVSKPFV